MAGSTVTDRRASEKRTTRRKRPVQAARGDGGARSESRSEARSGARSAETADRRSRRQKSHVDVAVDEGAGSVAAGEGASGDGQSDARFDQLRGAVAELRTRVSEANVERPLLITGTILLPLGLVAVVLGWMGAANTPFVFEQVPYLISGGLLGVAMAVVGGFLYFGYWLTRIVQEQRTHTDRLAASLGRIEALLGGNGAAPQGGAPAASPSPSPSSFVATQAGSMFHRSDCPVVSDRSGLRPVKGTESGFEPCGICDPLSAD